MEQPLGNKIARARNKQAAFRLGKRWRAKATGEGEEAEDATGDGMAADDGLLGDGAKLDEETKGAIRRFVDERVHTETYDAQFEGERVFLKSRAVPYIDGDREMRQRRAATQQRNRASGAGPSPYREGRADPVQIGFLEAAVYGNGPQSRLMRSRSTPRHSAREPSDSVAAPAAAATLPRPLPRSSSMRSDVVRESGSHQPTLAELVSQRKHVPLPDLSRQDGLPSVAEEENGDEDATTSFDSGASSRQRDRRRALARLTVPTALHLQRVSKNSERRRQRQREARARSAIQRSESPVSDGHGSPSPVRRLRRRPWGGSAPMLPALRKGADQGGASSPSVTHPSTGRATVPRDSSAERAGHKGMGRTRDTARASGRAQTRTNSRRSMEAGAAEEEGGTLPALLHEPVSAVEERQPMQGHTDVLVAKAVACLDRGEPASALEHCRVALSHDHRHFGARFQHGVAEFHLGHYEAAVRDLTAAMRAPTAARHRLEFAFYNRGLAHAQLGEYDAAVEDLGRALRKDPVNKLFWDARGLIHRRALQFREARDDYTTLRSLARRKPDDEVAKRILEAQQRFKQQEEGGDAEADSQDAEAEIRRALRTPAKRRSDAQCRLLARECKVWSKVFLRFTDDVLESMWSSLELETFNSGNRIFDANSLGDKFYIIFAGAVSVRVPLTKDDSEGASARALAARHEHDEVEVSTLGPGDTFGELAIVQGGVRQASIVATESTETVSLGAEEYRRTVKLQEDKLLSSKIEFLHRALLFDPLGEERVEKIAHIARTHVYERGETILQQGADVGKLFILWRGLIRVDRKVQEQEPPFSEVTVHVCTLTPHDIFGEEALLHPAEAKTPATFTCETKVECLELHHRQLEPEWIGEEMRSWIKQLGVRYSSDAKYLQLALDHYRWERRQTKIVKQMRQERKTGGRQPLRGGGAQYMKPVHHRAQWR